MTNIHQLAVEVAEERGFVEDDTDEVIWEQTPTLFPGTDFQNGTLYMTFPFPRNAKKYDRKGKMIGRERIMDTLVVTSERTMFWYDQKNLEQRGYQPAKTLTQLTDSPWPVESIKDYLENERDTIDPMELWSEIRAEFSAAVEYTDEIYYDIAAYYVMMSYVFRTFDNLGYLHFNGTAASGKSQNLRLLNLLGFNSTWTSNMSGPSLFRSVAGAPGLVCVDEAESWEGERGTDIRQLLLAGYSNPGNARRMEKEGERWMPVDYSTYSPKALASINPLDPVLQSRCIVIPMQPAIRTVADIRRADPKWAAIREKLYIWAMQHSFEIGELRDEWSNGLRDTLQHTLNNRAWEVAFPLICLAHHVNGQDEAIRMIRHFEIYFAEMRKAQDEVDRQRTLLKALPRLFATKPPVWIDGDARPFWTLKDIHDVTAEYLESDAQEYYKTRATSKHLTALGWRERRSAKGGTIIPITEEETREQFGKRKIEPFAEDTDWLNKQANHVGERRSTNMATAEAMTWESIVGADEPNA